MYQRFIIAKEIGLSADNIDIYLQGLLEFSKTSGMSILPISKIDIIREKTEEKIELENQIEDLKQEIQELNSERSTSKKLRDDALQQQKTTTFDIQWYLDLKGKHGSEYGIPLEDISIFAKTVNGFKQYGYDVSKVVNEFSNLELLKFKMNTLKQDIQTLETKLASLNKQCSMTEAKVLFHNEAISNYTNLESIGFGLKELTFLWGIVNEVSDANNIPLDQVPLKFITDNNKSNPYNMLITR